MTRAVLRIGAVLALCTAGCRGTTPEYAGRPVGTGGDAARGRHLIQMKSCGACHTIPGVPGARGRVAMPLTAFAERTYIAGEVPNTPENLVAWVQDPRRIEPKTAMPAVGLSEQEARDVAAYLYALR